LPRRGRCRIVAKQRRLFGSPRFFDELAPSLRGNDAPAYAVAMSFYGMLN